MKSRLTAAVFRSYGAFELKRCYQKHLAIALVISACIPLIALAGLWFYTYITIIHELGPKESLVTKKISASSEGGIIRESGDTTVSDSVGKQSQLGRLTGFIWNVQPVPDSEDTAIESTLRHPPPTEFGFVLIGPKKAVRVGDTLSFPVRSIARNPDSVKIEASKVPRSAEFRYSGGNMGYFIMIPGYDEIDKKYVVTFKASYRKTASRDTLLESIQDVEIMVTNKNLPPEWDAIGLQSVHVGDTLRFSVRATDPDGDRLTLTCSNRPENATFTDRGNETGLFVFAPTRNQVGSHNVTFIASDNNAGSASLEVRTEVLKPTEPIPPRIHEIYVDYWRDAIGDLDDESYEGPVGDSISFSKSSHSIKINFVDGTIYVLSYNRLNETFVDWRRDISLLEKISKFFLRNYCRVFVTELCKSKDLNFDQ
jgi:hypothetical protein